jgi:hypothetical protein
LQYNGGFFVIYRAIYFTIALHEIILAVIYGLYLIVITIEWLNKKNWFMT